MSSELSIFVKDASGALKEVPTLASLIALFPPALGQGSMAQGLRVVLPADQTIPPAWVGAERDSTGLVFYPTMGSHAFAYDTDSNLLTDTVTNGSVVRRKTFTYTSGRLSTETPWVVV